MCHLSVDSRPARESNVTLSRHRNWFSTETTIFGFYISSSAFWKLRWPNLNCRTFVPQRVGEILTQFAVAELLRAIDREYENRFNALNVQSAMIFNSFKLLRWTIVIATWSSFSSFFQFSGGMCWLFGTPCMQHAAPCAGWMWIFAFGFTQCKFPMWNYGNSVDSHSVQNVPSCQNTGLSLQSFDKTGHWGRDWNHQISRRFTWDAIQRQTSKTFYWSVVCAVRVWMSKRRAYALINN